MRMIGDSINDAIDWTQDLLQGTRPVAETVLFSLMTDRKVKETEQGFVLYEDDDEELKRRGTVVRHSRRYHRRGSKFHMKLTNKQLTNRIVHDNDDDESPDETPHALL